MLKRLEVKNFYTKQIWSNIWKSDLTIFPVQQSDNSENLPKGYIGDMYIDYSAALEMCELQTLSERGKKDALTFPSNALNMRKIADVSQ